jgi:hypothetical protein
MVSFGNFFIVSPFESYIVHYKSNVDACIWTKDPMIIVYENMLKTIG